MLLLLLFPYGFVSAAPVSDKGEYITNIDGVLVIRFTNLEGSYYVRPRVYKPISADIVPEYLMSEIWNSTQSRWVTDNSLWSDMPVADSEIRIKIPPATDALALQLILQDVVTGKLTNTPIFVIRHYDSIYGSYVSDLNKNLRSESVVAPQNEDEYINEFLPEVNSRTISFEHYPQEKVWLFGAALLAGVTFGSGKIKEFVKKSLNYG